MITGAIDYAGWLPGGRIAVSGWASVQDPDARRPTDEFRLVNRSAVSVSITDRSIEGVSGCGFEFALASADDLAALYWGGCVLYAHAGGDVQAIYFWEGIAKTVQEIISAHLAKRLGGEADALEMVRNAQRAKRSREEIAEFLDAVAATSYTESVIIERGTVSQDSEVTIGRDGFLFLLGGSNAVLQQYDRPFDAILAARWIELIRKREDYCTSRGIKFCQMIVPEKQSVIPEFYPIPLEAPTKLFAAIELELYAEPFFANCQQTLRDLFVLGGLHPYRKIDSHLSYFGAESLIRRLMHTVEIQPEIFAQTLVEEWQTGDLGGKFFQGNMKECVLMPTEDWEFSHEAPTLIHAHAPDVGHTGTVLDWQAHKAVSNQTVLIFGNSMFERGGNPLTLSWWLSRIFARTRFVWSSSLEEEHVDDLSPDLIICQTVERFLPTLPRR